MMSISKLPPPAHPSLELSAIEEFTGDDVCQVQSKDGVIMLIKVYSFIY